MEFIEAPAFTRYVSEYLADEEFRELQNQLANNPALGDLMPGTGGSGNFAGQIQSVVKAGEVVCGSFTTISRQTNKSG